jgi:hypothetical protein
MFAIINMSAADALIACWRAKYDFAFWRPVTAIQLGDTDGNRDTIAEPTWTPLQPTPAYPDYTAGHACMTGAVSKGASALFGRDDIDLFISSSATGTTRHYTDARTLNRDTMDARVWLGIHFRKAVIDGNRLGRKVARFSLARYFQPTR